MSIFAVPNGSLAQLVQSICLTSRGSGVRIPQLPLIIERHRRIKIRRFFLCFMLRENKFSAPFAQNPLHSVPLSPESGNNDLKVLRVFKDFNDKPPTNRSAAITKIWQDKGTAYQDITGRSCHCSDYAGYSITAVRRA